MSELKRLTRADYEARLHANGAAPLVPGAYDSDRLQAMMAPLAGDRPTEH
jgi:hypothetical protein